MLCFTLNRAYSDGTYCWLTGVDTDGELYLGTVYVQTTVTLALREYNLPNTVTPLGWSGPECDPCHQTLVHDKLTRFELLGIEG